MANIIIIGAGVAGLAAALTLAHKGHQVTILEARTRLGGRIYTITGADPLTPIELGASFWEGLPQNPFYQRYFSQKKAQAHQPSTQLVTLDTSLAFLMADQSDPKRQSHQRLVSTYQQAQHYLHGLPQRAAGKTCQAYIDHLFGSKLNPDEEQFWCKKWVEHDLRHHCTSLSLRGFGSFKIPADPDHLETWNDEAASFCFVKGGFHKVVIQLSKECTELGINILLNQQVLRIDDQGNSGVEITTSSAHFKADKVISTIPVGVLKKTAHQLFVSGLSAAKHQAIQSLGVHEATRIVLAFDAPFWHCLKAPYLFIANEHSPGFKEFRINFPLHQKAILQTDSYANVAQILLTKKNDQKAHHLLIGHLMQDLRKIFPTAPWPTFYAIHHWSHDPFAQGAYPYRTILMSEAVQQALERPEGNIYFAGADFSRHGFSVHNAYANGKKIAELLHITTFQKNS